MMNIFRTSSMQRNVLQHGLCRFFSNESTMISRCTKNLTDLLNPVKLIVTSTNGDPNGSHIQIECVSEVFNGKSTIQRQKLVYKAIWEELNGPVHAVDYIIAKTPQEAANTSK